VALDPSVVAGAALVVDALFGAGLSRELDGSVPATLAACAGRPVIAVDTPSGVSGDTAQVDPAAPQARLTVTFFRQKPGHLLVPNRIACGRTVVADIGIPEDVLDTIAPQQWCNDPDLWRHLLPAPSLADHKYSRGHVLVRGGAMSGAGRLAAHAAARAGAGMVTLLAPAGGGALPDAVIVRADDPDGFAAAISEKKVTAAVVGPGNGVDAACRDAVLAALATAKPTVLDADALTVMADETGTLFDAIRGPCVLTPHSGEFARVFGATGADKLTAVRTAAAESGAVVVLKGGDTLVAAPDGRVILNANAPAWLATAGAGDVLAGIIGALLAQGLPPFEAAAAAAWIHGRAAEQAGAYLIADDLPGQVGNIMVSLAGDRD
jgi:NAD(P)H-hydrate epimerase